MCREEMVEEGPVGQQKEELERQGSPAKERYAASLLRIKRGFQLVCRVDLGFRPSPS
jgi:hypothetical protein